MHEEATDRLLSALAHSGRRRMLDLLMEAPGISVKALASHFPISRVAVLKHVQLLEEAELVITKKRGRTRHLYFNPVPIQLLRDRWTNHYSAFFAERVADIKSRVEGRAMDEQENKRA